MAVYARPTDDTFYQLDPIKCWYLWQPGKIFVIFIHGVSNSTRMWRHYVAVWLKHCTYSSTMRRNKKTSYLLSVFFIFNGINSTTRFSSQCHIKLSVLAKPTSIAEERIFFIIVNGSKHKTTCIEKGGNWWEINHDSFSQHFFKKFRYCSEIYPTCIYDIDKHSLHSFHRRQDWRVQARYIEDIEASLTMPEDSRRNPHILSWDYRRRLGEEIRFSPQFVLE